MPSLYSSAHGREACYMLGCLEFHAVFQKKENIPNFNQTLEMYVNFRL